LRGEAAFRRDFTPARPTVKLRRVKHIGLDPALLFTTRDEAVEDGLGRLRRPTFRARSTPPFGSTPDDLAHEFSARPRRCGADHRAQSHAPFADERRGGAGWPGTASQSRSSTARKPLHMESAPLTCRPPVRTRLRVRGRVRRTFGCHWFTWTRAWLRPTPTLRAFCKSSAVLAGVEWRRCLARVGTGSLGSDGTARCRRIAPPDGECHQQAGQYFLHSTPCWPRETRHPDLTRVQGRGRHPNRPLPSNLVSYYVWGAVHAR
jgi:hypothetical protein